MGFGQHLTRNTALVAENHQGLVAGMTYRLKDFEEGHVVSFICSSDKIEVEVLGGLIETLLYWHPYLKRVTYNQTMDQRVIMQQKYIYKDQSYHDVDRGIDVFKVAIDKIVPEQLCVNQDKLQAVKTWLKRPEDVVVTCVDIQNKMVCVDGYTRLLAAYQEGFSHVYACFEIVEDTSFYEVCLQWCDKAGIKSIGDLSMRVVDAKTHQKIWVERCQAYFQSV